MIKINVWARRDNEVYYEWKIGGRGLKMFGKIC
jgi:hypothetical protein